MGFHLYENSNDADWVTSDDYELANTSCFTPGPPSASLRKLTLRFLIVSSIFTTIVICL